MHADANNPVVGQRPGANHRLRARCLGAVLLSIPCLLFFSGPADEVQQICEATAWTMDDGRTVTVALDNSMREYVEVCQAVFPTMEEAVQRRLLRKWRSGRFHSVLHCNPHGCPETCDSHPPRVDLHACGRSWRKKRDEEMGPRKAEMLRVGLRPLQERTVTLPEILSAFKRGEVARFDAKQYLPRRMFNITLAHLARLEKSGADEAPLHTKLLYGAETLQGYQFKAGSECPDRLQGLRDLVLQFGATSLLARLIRFAVVPLVLRRSCHPSLTLSEVAEKSKNFTVTSFPVSFANASRHKEGLHLLNKFRRQMRAISSSNIHLQRLPGFTQGFNFTAPLGISKFVEMTHSYLWIGASPGAFHGDLQDNVLIELSGEAEAVIIPPNCTLTGPSTQQILAGKNDFLHQRDGSTVPFFHLHLRPGDGVVIPSNSLHWILSGSTQRIAVNAFFEPYFGQMQWTSALGNKYKQKDPDRLAARALWLRSLRRLWDERRVHLVMHTARLEYL